MSFLFQSLLARSVGASLIVLGGSLTGMPAAAQPGNVTARPAKATKVTKVKRPASAAVAAAAAAAAAEPAAAQADEHADCGCHSRGRVYTAEPTADVLALWAAARAGREPEFMALLPKVAKLDEYAVDGDPLLNALLLPPEARERDQDAAAKALAAHRARLPAMARMIAAALKHGASATDSTDSSPKPALHLALLYGSPEIVKLLLGAGVPVDQKNLFEGHTALESVLQRDHGSPAPASPVTRAERSAMLLQLLAAGAQRPFKDQDEEAKAAGGTGTMADHIAWAPLLEQTEGGEVVRALMKTGTRPVFDAQEGSESSPLALAAAAGNAGAVEVLRTLVPPAPVEGKKAWSIELDAALAAASNGHFALAKSLTAPGMPFEQEGWRPTSSWSTAVAPAANPGATEVEVPQGTLLHFAVRAGDAAWVRQLVGLGASMVAAPDSQMPGALAIALSSRQSAMVALLLELGADPLAGSEPLLLESMEKGTFEDVQMLLGQMDSKRRAAIGARSGALAVAWSRSKTLAGAQDFPRVRALLEKSGFDAKQVSAPSLGWVIRYGAAQLARALILGGAQVDCTECKEYESGELDFWPRMPLTAALSERDDAMVEMLLARGAHAARADKGGFFPMQVALGSGQEAMVTRLQAAGATFDFAPGKHGSALDLAIQSGRIALVDKVAAGKSLATACLETAGGIEQMLGADKAYLDALIARGLRFNAPCGERHPVVKRVYAALLMDRQPFIGARRTQMAQRLARIDGSGGAAVRLDEDEASPLGAAIARHRADLVGVLLESGAKPDGAAAWQAIVTRQPAVLKLLVANGALLSAKTPNGATLADHVRCNESESFRRVAALPGGDAATCPAAAPMNAQEKAKVKSLVGHYYLKGMTEVGAELLLRADGSFDYAMAYGAVDTAARGRWRVKGNSVVFSTPPGAAGQPFRLAGATRVAAQSGIALRFRHRGKAVRDLTVYVEQADPAADMPEYAPTEQDEFWIVPGLAARPDVIAIYHAGLPGNMLLLDLPASADGAAANRFDFELDPTVIQSGADFNQTMKISGRALVTEMESGRPMRFER